MEGKNLIRKIWWFKDWQIQDIEGWLAEMSAQGWHLHSIGSLFAKFTKGEPKSYRYFYSALPKKGKEGYIVDIKQAGWEFVADKGKDIQLFRQEEKAEPLEPGTYFQERNKTVKTLTKGILATVFRTLGGVLAFIIPAILNNDTLLFYTTDLALLAIVIALVSVSSAIFGLGTLYMVKKRLGWGEVLIPNEEYHGALLRRKITRIGTTLVLLIVFAPNLVITLYGMSTRRTPFPEETPAFHLSEVLDQTNLGDHSYISLASFLVPRSWELRERQGSIFGSSEGPYTMLTVKVYEARSQRVAQRIVNETVKELRLGTISQADIEDYYKEYIDALWVHDFDYDREHEFIIRKDSIVYHVFYLGKVIPLEDLISLSVENIVSLIDQ